MQTASELFDLAGVAISCRDHHSLAKNIAARAGAVFAAQAVLVWLYKPQTEHLECAAEWCEPPVRSVLQSSTGTQCDFLQEVLRSGQIKCLHQASLRLASLDHLNDRFRSQLTSAVGAPICVGGEPLGLLGLFRTSRVPFADHDCQVAEELASLLGQKLKNLADLETERQEHLATVERLTNLYDLGRTFTSCLELGELLPIVANKISSALGARTSHVWLYDPRSQQLHLAQKSGNDLGIDDGALVSANEGLLAEVAHRAAKLINCVDEEPPVIVIHTPSIDSAIHSWMGAPLRKGDEILGIVEVINKQDGTPFSEDDLFFLSTICEQATISLHNAKLLESERKVSALSVLLKIFQDITSAPDLDRVFSAVANQAGSIVNFDRFAIGYFRRGHFVLGAVSGEEQIPENSEMMQLREHLHSVAQQQSPVTADLLPDGWQVDPEGARPDWIPFLEKYNYHGFYGLALRDDQGPFGAIAVLSSQPAFLTASEREILTVLANQTTVAARNAQVLRQRAFTGFLRPLRARPGSAPLPLVRYALTGAAMIALLVIVPWPLRVNTRATVVPAQRRVVGATSSGVIERVFVKEGDLVQPGDLLAQINEGEHRIKLAQAQAALDTARSQLAEAEFRNDPSAAGQAHIRVDLHRAEVQLEQRRLHETVIRSPIAGIVITPKIEEKVGTFLRPGDAFAEIDDQDHLAAELSVPEADLPLVRSGKSVALKLNAFPLGTLLGSIERVGAQSRSESNQQYFLVRATFPNPGRSVKDGMVGRARIRATGGWAESGWYPIGYVLLRAPLRWLWMNSWSVLP